MAAAVDSSISTRSMSVADLYHIRRAIRRDAGIGYAPETLSRQGRARLCGLCFTAEAAYTCPRCHVPYCSLPCYRSHDCSAALAERTARSLPKEDVHVDDAERAKTLEILWRLETGEGVAEDESASEDDDTPEHLLRKLTVTERDQFASLLRHPDKAAKMYFHDETQVLWWQADTVVAPVRIPWSEGCARTSVDLRFHVLYVCLAYTYVLRHFGLASLACAGGDDQACMQMLVDLVPFFAPQHSRMTLHSAQEASLYFLQVVGLTRHDPLSLLLSLLRSVADLVKPRAVHGVDQVPHAYTLWALADMHALVRNKVLLAKKLAFYAACVHPGGAADVASLHPRIEAYIARLEREQDERVHAEHVASAHAYTERMDVPVLPKPRIEVLRKAHVGRAARALDAQELLGHEAIDSARR